MLSPNPDFPKVFMCMGEDLKSLPQIIRNTNPDPLKYKGVGLMCYSDHRGGCDVTLDFFAIIYSMKL